MNDKIIKIAQIGVGYWGPNLLRNLVTNGSCEVKTVVDHSKERRHFVRDLYPSIKVSFRVEDIINDAEIKAVVIATPVATHFDFAIKCLEAGKHILVEKPIATTVDEVQQIGKLAKEKGLVAMVGHTFLFNSAVRYVKELIDTGELGDIRYVYSQRVNLGRIRSDVDALWNLAPHDVSIIQYWLGDPEPISVNRRGMDYVQNGIDEVVFMNIEYPDNVMANIHVSWLDPHKIRRMTVVGSKKMVVYDDIAENKIAIYDKGIDRMAVLGENMDFDNPAAFNFNHRSGDVVMPKINWVEPLKTEIAHFVDCIQNGTECLTGPFHAEKVVQILEHSL
jgi:predicted dehydrogenase